MNWKDTWSINFFELIDQLQAKLKEDIYDKMMMKMIKKRLKLIRMMRIIKNLLFLKSSEEKLKLIKW